MKKLFFLARDNGDGSCSINYTFNEKWIEEQENREDADSGSIGFDGDGFHYSTLILPEECTLKSLGIYCDCAVED